MKTRDETRLRTGLPGEAADIGGAVGSGRAPGCPGCDRRCRYPGRQMIVERVANTPAEVRRGLARIMERLAFHRIGSAGMHTIEVVLAECMNNVVEHAHLDHSDGWMDLCLCLSGDELFCRVEDGGSPMPGLTLPSGRPHKLSVAVEDLPEGGFGWLLIRSLTSGLSYARRGERNVLCFAIRLGREG